MRKIIILAAVLLLNIVSLFATDTPNWEEVNATDTLEFYTTDIIPELSDKDGLYIFGIYSEDGKWKTQLNYHSTSAYGHFTDEDFDLEGNGKNYNFIRDAKNDMIFYAYRHLDVTITLAANGDTKIEINGLINPNYYQKDVYRRVLIHATLPAHNPMDTVRVDFGHAFVSYNAYLDYYSIEAESKDYILKSGLFASNLEDGEYTTTELIQPYLITKATQDTLSLCLSCEHVLRISHADDVHYFEYDILSKDIRLYRLTFDDAASAIEPVDTINVHCYTTTLTDASNEYGVYAYTGESNPYQVTLAVNLSAIENKQQVYSDSDINKLYSAIYNSSTNTVTQLASATASLVDNGNQTYTLHADLIGRDQVLYRVTMPIGYNELPDGKDTIQLELKLGRVDYSTGQLGAVGIVGYNEENELYIYFYNEGVFDGHLDNEYFYTDLSYMTKKTESGFRFSDIKYAHADFKHLDEATDMTFMVYTINDELFQIHMTMGEYTALSQSETDYYISRADDVLMVALRDTTYASGEGVFTIQFQYADDYDEQGDPIGDQQYFTFQILTNDSLALGGTYGYSQGNMNISRRHIIIEDDVEIYLGAYAGELSITPMEQVMLNVGGVAYKSFLYEVSSAFLAENGNIYNLYGCNMAIVIDEKGYLLELNELTDDPESIEITDHDGHILKKQLVNGLLFIERDNRRYSVMGY